VHYTVALSDGTQLRSYRSGVPAVSGRWSILSLYLPISLCLLLDSLLRGVSGNAKAVKNNSPFGCFSYAKKERSGILNFVREKERSVANMTRARVIVFSLNLVESARLRGFDVTSGKTLGSPQKLLDRGNTLGTRGR
jgi:hypothetical protein